MVKTYMVLLHEINVNVIVHNYILMYPSSYIFVCNKICLLTYLIIKEYNQSALFYYALHNTHSYNRSLTKIGDPLYHSTKHHYTTLCIILHIVLDSVCVSGNVG